MNQVADCELADYQVELLTEMQAGDLEEVNALLKQLSRSARPLSFHDLQGVVHDEANRVYAARAVDGTIVGYMLLVIVQQFVGVKCWIEDVVVDERWRRKGIARAMLEQAIAEAKVVNAKNVNLTSKLEREAAHELYYALGFVRRDETAVFRLPLQ